MRTAMIPRGKDVVDEENEEKEGEIRDTIIMF